VASTLTADHIVAIYTDPNTVTKEQAEVYLPYLIAACKEYGITTKLRVAGFLSQLGVESGELIYWEELADGSDYEWREDLGNIYEGDGRWFKGHGPIQITGRGNHIACGEALGLDLVNYPTLIGGPHPLSVDQIRNGFRSSGWYWTQRGNDYRERYGWPANLNLYADEGDIDALCIGVNGGWHGYNERVTYYNRALEVLPDDLDLSESLEVEEVPEVAEEPEVAKDVLVYTDDDSYIRARENDAYVWMLQGANTPAKADESGYIYVPGLPGGGPDAAALPPTQADKLVSAADSNTWLRTASGSYFQGEGMSDHDLQVNLRGWVWDRTAWEAKPKDDRFWPVADTPPDPNSWSYVDQHPTRYDWVASVEKLARDLCKNFPVWCNTYYGHPPPEIVGGVDYSLVSMDVWNPGGRGDTLDWNVHTQVCDYVMNDPNPPYLAWVCSKYYLWTPGGGWTWYSNDESPATDYAHIYHLHMTFALDS
jgi:predicted chitinase